jgi:hypothetical protein
MLRISISRLTLASTQLHKRGLHGHGPKLAALCFSTSHKKLCVSLLPMPHLLPSLCCPHVIFALDKEALKQLRSAGAHAFYIADVQLHASSQGDQGAVPLADLSTRSR